MKKLLKWLGRPQSAGNERTEEKYIEVSLEDVKKAVLAWEVDMGDMVDRTVLLRGDQSIELSRLRRYLGGVSNQMFYMSRTTFQIFNECDKHIPISLDLVQAAVDDYLNDHSNLPVIQGTRNREIHYDKLIQEHYLKEKPSIPLYLTNEEFMLTHEPDWHIQHE